MAARIPEFIQTKIPKNSSIVLALSGGPDSMYLLHQCLEAQKKHPFEIIIAHVNHGLRGKESEEDALFVEKLAAHHKLPYKYLKLDLKKKKGNLEELGRNARYAFFEKIRQKYKAEWILTAHHRNDNIETALFNLIRGSSLNGIKGMQMVHEKKHLLRPLLSISKKEILDFLKKHKIRYRTDKSNDDLAFSRNFLRKKIIPLFQKINPNFEQTFGNNLENFTEAAKFIAKESEAWLKKNKLEKGFSLENFLNEVPFFQKNILASLYKQIHGSTKKLTSSQLEEILKVLHQKKANRKKEFGPNYFIKIDRKGSKEHYIWLESA